MFIQYYRYHHRHFCETLEKDPHLEIAYPADAHGMITAAHDFYVIGTFHDLEVLEDANLTITLSECSTGRTVRTVGTAQKFGPLCSDAEGIVSEASAEAIAASGMPDLAYDPENPESLRYTWNKAFYSDIGFSALIYGGDYGKEEILQEDQFGNSLEPLAEGLYELRVTLHNGDQVYTSAKTVLLAVNRKEIILSRFSPAEHVQIVERFSRELGFEPFTDPYAGIWDPKYFNCPWHCDTYLEIPARWHWGDAQEYESGVVHCFQHNISKPCVSYQIEIANMLRLDPSCVDDTERLKFYYYPSGTPDPERTALEQLEVMAKGRYAFVTGLAVQDGRIRAALALKPIPAQVRRISGCTYEILNRISHIRPQLQYPDGTRQSFGLLETGLWKTKDDGSREFLILEAECELEPDRAPQGAILVLEALDLNDEVCETLSCRIG